MNLSLSLVHYETLPLKLGFKNKCLHLLYIIDLQQINNYNTYNMIIIQNHKNYEILY